MKKKTSPAKRFYSLLFVLTLLSTEFQADSTIKQSPELLEGIIQSAELLYEVIEPKAHIYTIKKNVGKNSRHSHAMFSEFHQLYPMTWFDRKKIYDAKSIVLKNVTVKLTNGDINTLPYVLLRHANFSTNAYYGTHDYIKKHIINGDPGKLESGSAYKYKGKLTFYKKNIILSTYTKNKNDNINIVIANLKILSLYIYGEKEHTAKTIDGYISHDYSNYGFLYFDKQIDPQLDSKK